MIKLRELNLRTIRKMTMRNRLQAINEVNRSALSFTMFSMMTPTQFAELFPRYYRERNPDIQGFMNALPTSLTAAQQKAREQQLAQTASGSAAGSDFNARGYVQEYKDQMTRERSAHVGGRGGRGGPPPATLSPEQDKAFSYVQSGDMDVGSDIMKNNLGKLSTEELSSIGITKITKEGKEYYHYNKPEMTDEQATARLKSGSNQVEKILDTIEGKESQGRNIHTSGKGSAQGYFQYVDGTWQALTRKYGIGTEYKHAIDAPHDVQRAVARANVQEILRENHGDVSKVPLIWYTGKANPAMDVIPSPEYGNKETAREYMDRWMKKFGGPSQAEEPKGENGQYSREQLDRVKEQYAQATTQSQKQKYAEILQKQGINPETGGYTGPSNTGTGKEVTAYLGGGKNGCGKGTRLAAGQLFGNSYFTENGLGGGYNSYAASTTVAGGNDYFQRSGMYQNGRALGGPPTREEMDAYPIGTVVSAGGGNAKGQGHTQIKVAPNKWVSFFDQGNTVLMGHPGHQYNNWTAIIPNEKGMKALQDNGYATNTTSDRSAKANRPPADYYHPDSEQPADHDEKDNKQKTKVESETAQKIPEGAHVTFDQKTGRVEQKTETKVTVSEKKPEPSKPEPPKPEAPKPPEGSHVTTDVKSNRVEQKPEVKKTVTPAPEKKAEVKPTPEAPKPAETAKVEPPKPEPQKVAEAKPTEKPKTPVPTAAKGGKFNADADTLRIEPIGGLTKDGMTDTAVLMSGDRPVSTLNPNRETVTTKNNQVSIQPVGKESKLNPPPQPQNSTPDNLATAPVPKPQATPNRAPDNSRDATMVNDLLEMSKPIFRNVSSMRAFSRANFEETGSAIDWNHHSLGTPNLK